MGKVFGQFFACGQFVAASLAVKFEGKCVKCLIARELCHFGVLVGAW